MADYIALDPASRKQYLIRRADSERHAHQLLAENLLPGNPEIPLLELGAGSAVEIPQFPPTEESPLEPPPDPAENP